MFLLTLHCLALSYVLWFCLRGSWSLKCDIWDFWRPGLMGGILPERIYFISLRRFGLLPTWHHFELNSQLAGWGNKQVVWIQAETCLRTEFWLQTPQKHFLPALTAKTIGKLNWLSCRVYFFISSSHFHWVYSTYEDLKTNFVLCTNPGFVSSPPPLLRCDSACQLLLHSSQGWLRMDLLPSSLTWSLARFSSS